MITSTGNAQIKEIINLLKKSGERRRRGLFVIEGIRMFSEIPKERLDRVYVSESFMHSNTGLLSEYSYEVVSDKVFAQMSETKTPQGILAVVKMLEYSLLDIIGKAETPLITVLENIQDPGNLGTIIRTSEGAGVTGIIMSKDTVDIYNPKTIRSTMGALFRMPFIYVDSLSDLLADLKKQGIKLFAAHLKGSKEYYNENFRVPAAILIGNEGNGLTDDITKCTDTLVKIPMNGGLESLNAAVSAAIILYEALRQRAEI